jgi:hypothetical protein
VCLMLAPNNFIVHLNEKWSTMELGTHDRMSLFESAPKGPP